MAHMALRDAAVAAIRAKVSKGQYRRDIRAGATWVGYLIGRQLNLDTGSENGRRLVRTVLQELTKEGFLAVELRYLERDHHHNPKVIVTPGPTTTKSEQRRVRRPSFFRSDEARDLGS